MGRARAFSHARWTLLARCIKEGVMQQNPDTPKSEKPVQTLAQKREDRLKAALKANMAKRKAQAKARANDSENEGR
jgi:hypothetical protein